MKYTVERIENNCLILESEQGVLGNVDQALLPDVKEGDIITLTVDQQATAQRKEKIQNRLNNLFGKKG